MEENNKDLFDRFSREELSPSELKEFYNFLNKGNKEDHDDLYSTEWDNSLEYSGEYNNKGHFDRIRKDLKLINVSKQGQPKVKRYIILPLKYAAVLFVGIGLSWFLMKQSNKAGIVKNIRPCTINVAYGSKTSIQLPDGSMVHLNSGSTLSYPANFESSNRTVTLKGEGFFDVIKDSSRPFYVKTAKITVKVLGTSFNVKSYPDESTTEATLVTGKIEIYKNEDAKLPHQLDNIIAILQPKQKAIIYNNNLVKVEKTINNEISQKIEPLKSTIKIEDKIKTELFTDWKNDVLVFNNEKFADIITVLERWYNVEISMKNERLGQMRFSGKFDLESVSEVLDALSLIQNFTYDIRKNKITIN